MDKHLLRWNGWGLHEGPDVLGEHAAGIWSWLGDYLGLGDLPNTPATALADAALPPMRLDEPHFEALRGLLSPERVKTDAFERAYHARGRGYHDLLHLRAGRLDTAPDAVVYPESIAEIQALAAYAAEKGIALVPYGGGSSVVGGVTPQLRQGQCGSVTVDMARMNRVLEINQETMTAHIEAGIYGPQLEQELQAANVTLGHYPQSFEYSTLGGWIAARGAGHQSNKYGKAEDWLAGARIVTPQGIWTTETVPKSAAGPLLRDLVPGSEGAFGIIADAWVRVHAAPEVKCYRAFFFQSFADGVNATRALLQQGVPTAMVRLSDANETFFYSVLHGGAEVAENGPIGFCLMLIGFEGDQAEVDYGRSRAEKILRDFGGADMGSSLGEMWLTTRFDTPYLRDPMLDHGLAVDTIETAVDWQRLPGLHRQVCNAIEAAIEEHNPNPGAKGIVMAHVSHSYRTGASLYFTFVFARQPEPGAVPQWLAIKRAASDALIEAGGTISHHHGLGTDHLPWLEAEKSPIAINMLRALKTNIDPDTIMNPGKLTGLP